MNLQIGIEHSVEKPVTKETTAKAFGSGTDMVAATPFVVSLMENAAYNCVLKGLDTGFSTVGTIINIKHLKATPVGGTLKATAKLTQIDNKRLVFFVECYDDIEKVAEGEHERFVVETKKFMDRANSKLKKD